MKKLITKFVSSVLCVFSLVMIAFVIVSCGSKTHKVNFYSDKDKVTLLVTISVKEDEVPVYDYSLYGVPTKKADQRYSYTFFGWNDGEKFYDKDVDLPKVTEDKDFWAEFYANEEPEPVTEYTVKFLDIDGTELKSVTVSSGSKAAYAGTLPTKDNYVFVGWSLDDITYKTTELPKITKDTTFKAVYKFNLTTSVDSSITNAKESTVEGYIYQFEFTSAASSNKQPLVIKIGNTVLPLYVLKADGEYELKTNYVPLNGDYFVYISNDLKAYLVEPLSVFELVLENNGVLGTPITLTQSETSYNIWTSAEVTLDANTKVYINNTTSGSYASITPDIDDTNALASNLVISDAGKYVFTFDSTANTVLAVRKDTPTPPEPVSIYFVGDKTEWQKVDSYKLEEESGVYAIDVLLKKEDEFIIQIDSEYFNYEDLLETKDYLLDGNESNIKVSAYGNYKITFDSNNKISVALTDSYTVKINSNEAQTMALDMASTNADLQYSLALNVKSGDILTFNVTGITIDSTIGNNVKLNAENKIEVIATTTEKAYLKGSLNDSGEVVYTLWVSGYHEMYYMNDTLMTKSTKDVPEGYTQYELSTALTKDQELNFKLFNQTLEVSVDTAYGNNVKVLDDKIIVLTSAENEKVFLKMNNTTSTYSLWVGGYAEPEENFREVYVFFDASWLNENPKLAIYAFDSNVDNKSEFIELALFDGTTNIYKAKLNKKYQKLDLLRIKPDYTSEYDWNKKSEWLWNQTNDITTDLTKDLFIACELKNEENSDYKLSSYVDHTITFDANGGTAVTSITAKPFATITAPTISKVGHRLSGWYYGENLQTEFVFGDSPLMPTEDYALTAKWEANEYTITFVAEGADEGYTTTLAATYGEDLPDLPIAPTKSGSTFLYYDDADGNHYYYSDKSHTLKYMVADNITLTAVFSDDFIIIFKANGGVFAEDKETLVNTYNKDESEDIVVPTDPEKIGYNFIGYKKDNDQSIIAASAITGKVTASAIYEAQWEIKKFDVKFYKDEDTTVPTNLIETKQVEYNAKPKEIPTASKDKGVDGTHYIFTGWTDGVNTYLKGEDLPVVTADISYFAVYKEDKFSLTIGNAVVELTEIEVEHPENDLYEFTFDSVYSATDVVVIKNGTTALIIIVNNQEQENYHPTNGTSKVYISKDYKVYIEEPKPVYQLVIKEENEDDVILALDAVNPQNANEYFLSKLALKAGNILEVRNYVNMSKVEVTRSDDTGNELLEDFSVNHSYFYQLYFNFKQFTLDCKKTDDIVVTDRVDVVGTFNEWKFTDDSKATPSGNVYTKEFTANKGDKFQVVIDEAAWLGYSKLDSTLRVDGSNYTFDSSDGKPNKDIIIGAYGVYVLEFDSDTSIINIYPKYKYNVSVASGALTEMALDMNNVPEGVVAQYRLTISARIGDSISFAKGVDSITVEDPSTCEGNNVAFDSVTLRVRATFENKEVYLKLSLVNDVVKYSVWCSGYHDTYFLNINDASNDTEMIDASSEDKAGEDWVEQYKVQQVLSNNDVLTFKLDGDVINISDSSFVYGNNVRLVSSKIRVITTNVNPVDVYIKVFGTGTNKTYKVYVSGYKDEFYMGATAASPVLMEDASNEDKGGDTWDKQYRVQATLLATDELTFTLLGETLNITAATGNTKLVGDVTNKVYLYNAVADEYIYLKVYGTGANKTYKVWGSGRTFTDVDYYIHLNHNWATGADPVKGHGNIWVYASNDADGYSEFKKAELVTSDTGNNYKVVLADKYSHVEVLRVDPTFDTISWNNEAEWKWDKSNKIAIDEHFVTTYIVLDEGDSSIGATLSTFVDHTITFNTDGGSAVATITAKPYNVITAPANPTKDGFTFEGWKNNGVAYTFGETPTMPNGNLILDADWSITRYAITYNLDGGNLEVGKVNPNDYTIQTDDITLYNPVKAGYVFAGWSGTGLVGTENLTVTITTGSHGERTYTANWTAGTSDYTVEHYLKDLGAATFTKADTLTQNLSGTTGSTAEPSAKNDIEGFTYDSTNANNVISGTIASDGSLVLKFYYNRNTYDVTYSYEDAPQGAQALPTTHQREYGQVITVAQAPAQVTGYTFGGWASTDATVENGQFTMPDQAVSITGTWTINQYTITFDTDGGSEIAAITQNYGTSITAPSNPTKTGYEFAGWDVSIPTTMPSSDLTITASWTPITYKVRFNANEGSGTMADQTLTYDHATTLTINTFTKTNYIFAGWAKAGALTTIVYNDGQSVVNLSTTKDDVINLYAVWSEEYIVKFYGNGGTFGALENVTQLYPKTDDEDIVLPSPAPTRTGYQFQGYSTTSTGAVAAVTGKVTADADYYAIWQANTYSVSFNGNGNTNNIVMPNQAFTYDAVETALSDNVFERTGYTFVGWNTLENPTDLNPGTSYTDKQAVQNLSSTNNDEVTLYAQWEIVTYTITYNGLEGATLASENPSSYNVNTPTFQLVNPTKTGYTFKGWSSTDLTGDENKSVSITVGSTGNKEFTANWTINSYLVRFYNGTDLLESKQVNYQAIPTYTGETPTKATAAGIHYIFNGWNDGETDYALNAALPAITKATDFTAIYATEEITASRGTLTEVPNSDPDDNKYEFTLETTLDTSNPLVISLNGVAMTIHIGLTDYVHGTNEYYTVNGTYKVFIGKDGKAYLVEPEHVYKLVLRSTSAADELVDLTINPANANEYYLPKISLYENTVVKVRDLTIDADATVAIANETGQALDAQYTISENYFYQVYFRFKANPMNILIKKTESMEVEDRVDLVGLGGNWVADTTNDTTKMNEPVSPSSRYEMNIVATKNQEIKLMVDTVAWIGWGKLYSGDKSSGLYENAGPNDVGNIRIKYAGNYKVSFDPDTTTVYIELLDTYSTKLGTDDYANMAISTNDVPNDADAQYYFSIPAGATRDKELMIKFGNTPISSADIDVDGAPNLYKDNNNDIFIKSDLASQQYLYLKVTVNGNTRAYSLYLGGYQDMYYMGETLMTRDDAGMPSGCSAQYKVSGLTVTQGQELSFKIFNENITISEAEGNAVLNNSVLSIHNAATDVTVDLKVYVDGNNKTYKVYISKFEDLPSEVSNYYFYVPSVWYSDGAKVAVYAYNTEQNPTRTYWYELTVDRLDANNSSNMVYKLPMNNDYHYINVVRISSGQSLDWDHKINQTSNITLDYEHKDFIELSTLNGNDCPYTYSSQYASYVITFNSNSGSAVASSTKYPYENITIPTAPTRTGYTFGGWTTLLNGDVIVIDNTGIVAQGLEGYTNNDRYWIRYVATTLYAKWTANTYQVEFDKNGASGDTMSNQEFTYGVSENLSNNEYSRPGYTFTGWNTQANGTGTSYADGVNVKNLATSGIVILYAQWSAITYTITLNQNNATQDGTTSVTATFDSNILSSAINNPERTGYTFGGWTTAENSGSVVISTSGSLEASIDTYTDSSRNWIKASAVTLYAKWTANTYTVTLHLNGGDLTDGIGTSTPQENPTVNTRTYTYGIGLTLPTSSVISKTDYNFGGWYTSDGTSTWGDKVLSISITDLGDVEYWAKWTDLVAVTINSNYCSVVPSSGLLNIEVEKGSTVTVENNVITINEITYTATVAASDAWTYVFDSWNINDGDALTTPTTITATFTRTGKTYSVSFDKNGGSGETMANLSVTYGDAAKALTANTYTKEGYTFGGWNTENDGSGIAYANEGEVSNLTSNLTLYAIWRENIVEARVTLSTNDRTFNYDENSDFKPTVSSITNSKLQTLTASDYEVTYSSETWTNAGSYNITITGIGDYAGEVVINFTIMAKVSYDKNGGSGAIDDEYLALGAVIANDGASFSRNGYDFAGWGISADATTPISNIPNDQNEVTLYALWSGYIYLDVSYLTDDLNKWNTNHVFARVDNSSWVKLISQNAENTLYKLAYAVGTTSTSIVIFTTRNDDTPAWDSGVVAQTVNIEDMSTTRFGRTYKFINYKVDSKETGGWAVEVYFKPHDNWKQDNARFAMYCYVDNYANGWFNLELFDSENGIYKGTALEGYGLIFCRMNPATTANNWNKDVVWNQTANLSLDGINNYYVLTGGEWNSVTGSWSEYPIS